MKRVLFKRVPFLVLIPFMAGSLLLVMLQRSYADSIETLQASLPNQIGSWRAEPNDRLLDRETIFDYIDGAGEVYRAYKMRKCLSRRYTGPKGSRIVLDIFDMGSSADAFGVFTHDQDGKVLNLGQGALYRPGWLSFWKGRFFVSIYMEEESTAAEKAVKELGRMVASLIKSQGAKPRILSLLPRNGLQSRSIKYFHHYNILNYHYFLSEENILHIEPQTEAVLAKYRRDQKNAHLLFVMYGDRGKAAKAQINFIKHYLPEAASKGPVLTEDEKWSAIALRGKLLAIVLEADSKQLAESLLKEVTAGN